MVFRSLAARIESMMVTKEASTSGGTIDNMDQLLVSAGLRCYLQDIVLSVTNSAN